MNSDSAEKARKRQLCATQTAKKRELDRIAQKKSRERAKNRMSELEDKINRLQADDKQKQISDLMKVVETLRQENERLRNVTEKIRSLADSVGPTPVKKTGPRKNLCPALPVTQTQELGSPESCPVASQEGQEEWWESQIIQEDDADIMDFDLPVTCDAVSNSYTGVIEISPSYDFMPFSPVSSFERLPPHHLLNLEGEIVVVPDEQKWKIANEAFTFGIRTGARLFGRRPEPRNDLDRRVLNSHAAFKAILWGPDGDQEEERTHPLWLALRQVDEKVFGNWKSKAQRIASMLICHRLLLYRADPCKETLERLPTFYYPRPSQDSIQHPAIVDFFPWPGLRDRMVFSHKRYTTGDFSASYVSNLRFHWPFSDNQIFTFDVESKVYRLSALFEKYAFELSNWTMDEAFFETHAEMKHDIPSSGRGGERELDAFFDFMPMSA